MTPPDPIGMVFILVLLSLRQTNAMPWRGPAGRAIYTSLYWLLRSSRVPGDSVVTGPGRAWPQPYDRAGASFCLGLRRAPRRPSPVGKASVRPLLPDGVERLTIHQELVVLLLRCNIAALKPWSGT
jgi:hypothetical protein